MAVAGDGGEEVFRLLVADGALAETTPVGARSDAGIIAIAPVSEIVAALFAGASMVGNLIGWHAGRLGAHLCQLEHLGRGLCLNRLEFVLRHHGREARAGLDR